MARSVATGPEKMTDKKEQSGREVYPDIIDLPHWQSPKRRHMPLYDRAAQFAPFAALSGYDDMIAEEARETNSQLEQDHELLDRKLGMVSHLLSRGIHPTLSFTVFVPDTYKDGGEYLDVTGSVMKIDTVNKKVILDETILNISAIHDIRGSVIDDLDEMMP